MWALCMIEALQVELWQAENLQLMLFATALMLQHSAAQIYQSFTYTSHS